MSEAKLRRPDQAPATEAVEQLLPLVLEIIPGQAAEGLIDVYEPGTFEEQPLRALCQKTLSKGSWSIEEQQVLEDIQRQLDGGRLICRGRRIEGRVRAHAVVEETEEGEKYLYVAIRAIKPQEGGGPPAGAVFRAPRGAARRPEWNSRRGENGTPTARNAGKSCGDMWSSGRRCSMKWTTAS